MTRYSFDCWGKLHDHNGVIGTSDKAPIEYAVELLNKQQRSIDPQEVIDKMRQITIERQLCCDHEEDARYTYPERWDDLVDWLAGIRDGVDSSGFEPVGDILKRTMSKI